MTEVPPPPEATETIQPDPIRIFNKTPVEKDGLPIRPVQLMLYKLWFDQAERTILPGALRFFNVESDDEPKKSMTIQPKDNQASVVLEALRGKFERGVNQWIVDGKPAEYLDIAKFREHYLATGETVPQE